ncbi:hypothetical protein ACWC0A_30455 [Streptomyces scopuliridis]
MEYMPTVGDRIRVTRYRPDGGVHFVKTGKILGRSSTGFVFSEDGGPQRHSLAGSALVAELMSGWTQTIEPLTDQSADTYDASQCEGHYDDDAALTSGAGIGEPIYCDGSCVNG